MVMKKWGSYNILFKNEKIWLKKLTIRPGKSISYQKHKYRNEIWLLDNGEIRFIPKNTWHKISNTRLKNMVIIEFAFGYKVKEKDIERRVNYTF